ncbi:MAG TPA: hypothetical protein VGD15_17415 [Kribbella sp.]
MNAALLGADRLYAVSAGRTTGAIQARDTDILVDDDTAIWSSWNVFAEEFARDGGAHVLPISDSGITGPAFLEHVRRNRRPIINSPIGHAATARPSSSTADDIRALVTQLGDMAKALDRADRNDLAEPYEALDLAVAYDHRQQVAEVSFTPALRGVKKCVRGGHAP